MMDIRELSLQKLLIKTETTKNYESRMRERAHRYGYDFPEYAMKLLDRFEKRYGINYRDGE